jgi:hypothetical protein
MKRTLVVSFVVLVLCGCSGMAGRGRPAPVGSIAGTWELISPDMPGYREVKLLTGSRFAWVTYETETGMLVGSAGGTYELDGRAYIERLEFGSEALLLELIGRDQVFAADLEGDEWHHTGTLTNGVEVREVWKRLE